MIKRYLLCILLALIVFAGLGMTTTHTLAKDFAQDAQPVVLYFFWGDGCPHCAQQKPFLEELNQRYPNLEVRAYEIYNVPENRDLFLKMAEAVGFEARAVPTTIIGAEYWIGYSEMIAQEIEAQVAACGTSSCPDAGVGIIPEASLPEPTPTPVSDPPVEENAEPEETPAEAEEKNPDTNITVPLLGTVDLGARSLWISTAIIGFVDGVNPCSVWVLTILISLTLRMDSRKKIFIIGLTFISVTALVYVLFIAGLFTVLTVVSFMGWIQVAVALLALFFAAVNIKDYFWYKEGLSFTISDEKKPGLYKRMRRVMQAGDSMGALIIATIGLAAGVSLVEFSCTAGFPVLWTNLVTAQNVTPLVFALLLLLYMVIYQIDELAIFMAAVATMRATKLEEKHGRILKLFSGMLMLILAATMLVNPKLMNDLWGSLIVFGVAFGLAIGVLILHRKLLPRFGIYIGTELEATSGEER